MSEQPEVMEEGVEKSNDVEKCNNVEKSSDVELVKVEEEDEDKPPGKKALLMPKVVSLKDQVNRIAEMAELGLDVTEELSKICAEVRTLKQLADQFLSAASEAGKGKQGKDAGKQYVAKIQGLRQQHFKDMRNILQNALGMGTVKFSPTLRNSPYVEINFTTEELMNKGLKIVRNKPLGLTLCVVETRTVDKSRLPPGSVLDTVAAEFDPIIMFKESLQRSRELTEEEYNIMLEWKQKYIRHILLNLCEKLDSDVVTIVKDRTDGYYFKLENIRSMPLSNTDSERYQTYSGVNPDTGKVEMGYWGLGSDIPSRFPRSTCVKNVVKVLTDFMESSGKPFFDLRVRKGYWDSVMIRSNHVHECMVVLVVHSSSADAAKDCEAFKPQLVELFQTGDGKDCGVKSIHIKTLSDRAPAGPGAGDSRKTAKAANKAGGLWTHVYGDEHLDEEVAGLKVRLFRNTFFWGDGGCTQQLCETVAEELDLQQKCGVLEMGVSTGLICMYLAKRCTMVVGLDRVQSVLPMAKGNVERNDLENVTLVQGVASTTISSLKTHFKDCDDVYAVVTETSSNARSKEEVLGLRKSPWIKKVAYLIVSYKDVTSTLKLLCSKNLDASEPFVITKVIPFDVASTSVRPDMLLLLERPAALTGKTEKRVPKTKASQQGGPAAKKARMNPAAQNAGSNPRSLLSLGKKFGGVTPPMPQNRGFAGRGFRQNQQMKPGFAPRREMMQPWSQGGVANNLMQYERHMYNALRNEAEEEAILMERVRRQKEAQLQQIQDAVLDAQRRRMADALMQPPQTTPNIEEVVLSAIKKTGLLEKVSALTESAVPKQSMDIDNARRDDRWSANYNQRAATDDRPFNSGFQGRDNAGFQGREGRNGSGFQGRDSSGFQSRDTTGYQDRNVTGFQDRDSAGYQGRDSYQDVSGSFQSRDSYQDRDNSGYQKRDVGDSVYNSSDSYYPNKSYGSRYSN